MMNCKKTEAAGVRTASTLLSRLVPLVAILVSLAGCLGSPSPEFDEELSDALRAARESRDPVRFADLTSFTWDSVYVFEPYVSGEFVNDAIGAAVLSEDYQHQSDAENLIVFLENDSLAHAARVRRGMIDRPSGRFVEASSEAWLVPPAPGEVNLLRLEEELPG